MTRIVAPALCLAATLAAAAPARAQGAPQPYPYPYPYPPPAAVLPAPGATDPMTIPKRPESNGLSYIEAGIVLLSVGGVNLLTAPLCASDLVRRDLKTPCAVTTLSVGLSAATVGLPLLVVGLNKRRRFQEWRERYDVGFGVSPGGAMVSWQARF